MGLGVGALLRAARVRAGLTQAQLARLARTSQPAVSAYESGRKEPGGETLLRLLAAAGVKVDVHADQPTSMRDYLRRMQPEAFAAAEELAAVMARVAAGEEAWFALREFIDAANRVHEVADGEAVRGLVVAEPPPCGDPRWDGFAAALAEHLAVVFGFDRPAWVTRSERFLSVWWFPHWRRGFDALAVRESPAAFRRRGIFICTSMLERR